MINSSGFMWSADFKISSQEAEALDKDLMSAAEVQEVRLMKTCSIINSLRHPVNHPDAYEDADEILRMNEERLKDWRRNIAKIRGSHLLKINNTIVM
jgi:hypothetical protein